MLKDTQMFWILQSSVLLMVLVAFFVNRATELKPENSGTNLSVERGNESMSLFYGFYVALSGLLVALCLSVDIIKNYKVFWVLVDALAPAYICLFNPWSRNKLLCWVQYLRKIEA